MTLPHARECGGGSSDAFYFHTIGIGLGKEAGVSVNSGPGEVARCVVLRGGSLPFASLELVLRV